MLLQTKQANPALFPQKKLGNPVVSSPLMGSLGQTESVNPLLFPEMQQFVAMKLVASSV